MGNEQSALSGEHSAAPVALTEEEKEARAQRRAAELEQKRRENLRNRREAAEKKKAEKQVLVQQAAKKQAAEKEAVEKARLYIEKEREKQQETRRLALEAKVEDIQRQMRLAAQQRLPRPPPAPATSPLPSQPARDRFSGDNGDVPGQSEPMVEKRAPQPPTPPRAATNAATNALLSSFGESGNKSPPMPNSSIPPREPAWRAAPPLPPIQNHVQHPSGVSLPNRGRTDQPPSRRSSNDSGVELELAQPARAIKIPTGPRRVSDDNGKGIAPPQTNPSVKRLADSSVGERRQQGPSAIQTTPKRQRTSGSSSSSPGSPTTVPSAHDPQSAERQPPQWYIRLTIEHTRSGNEAAIDPLLKNLKTQIFKIKKSPADDHQKAFSEVRWLLHELPFKPVNEKLLRNRGMLGNETGLPQLFDNRYSGGVDWPFDIRSDAEELYNKWCSRIFETDLLRGIIPGQGKSNNHEKRVDRIDDKWPKVSSKYHGNGKLVNGQWWPTQLAAKRDGAHGEMIAGICGDVAIGAYSCVMAGGVEYAGKNDGDRDEGEVVYYCGTDSNDGNITKFTKLMIESYKNGLPLRLLRSHKVPSRWRPEMGLRYDGLYDIESYERVDPESSLRQRHRFKLVRQSGQDPIRGTGPEKRPTEQEMVVHQNDKRMRGVSGGGGKTAKPRKGESFPPWGGIGGA